MTNRFLISVATAALIATGGLANAQGPGGGGSSGGAGMSQGGSSGGAGMQGGGASERGNAPSQMNRDSAPSGGAAKGAQSDRMEGGKNAQSDRMEGTKGKSAQDDMKGQKSQQNTASDTDRKGGKDMKAEGRDGKDKMGDSRDQNRMGKDTDRTNAQTQGRESDRMNAQGGSSTTTQSGSQTTTTTGQAGAGAKISTEQRTQITSVIRQQNVAPVTNVNFNVSVGTRVPRDVHFHVLPQEVVTIYPQWRGFKFIRVKEEIVIVDPNTYEIVEIIRV